PRGEGARARGRARARTRTRRRRARRVAGRVARSRGRDAERPQRRRATRRDPPPAPGGARLSADRAPPGARGHHLAALRDRSRRRRPRGGGVALVGARGARRRGAPQRRPRRAAALGLRPRRGAGALRTRRSGALSPVVSWRRVRVAEAGGAGTRGGRRAVRELAGRTAVVTGAGSGIGRALARALAAEGCRLALVDVDPAGLEETRRRLPGAAVTLHVADVSDRARMAALPAEVEAAHGAVHLLFNNAGITINASFADSSLEDLERLIGVNL